jgi:LmbE family N-acetylglucosaminyl deacetylase
VERLAGLILEKNPEVIITHAPAEPCMEHQGTNLLVRKAYHKAQSMGYDGSFVCGLTVSPMGVGDFFDRYDTFIDISGYFQKKLKGIVIHSCQVPRHDHLELRDPNVGKTVGCEHAEAYTVANLSKTRTGELTGEFKKNHKYCIENWMKIFSVKE